MERKFAQGAPKGPMRALNGSIGVYTTKHKLNTFHTASFVEMHFEYILELQPVCARGHDVRCVAHTRMECGSWGQKKNYTTDKRMNASDMACKLPYRNDRFFLFGFFMCDVADFRATTDFVVCILCRCNMLRIVFYYIDNCDERSCEICIFGL